jgi:cyclohexyl-isocyanide hydratase
MDRRTFTQAAGATLAAAAVSSAEVMAAEPAAARPFTMGLILFDGMTYLDLAGPHDALTKVRTARVHLLAKSTVPITTDTGSRVLADMALREAPDLDLLFIGGGPGVNVLMEDAEMLGFLAARAPRAQWVTSVCTGALVLGAAGLLRGYRATTHWTAMEVLPVLGAIPVPERVVVDRNRMTGNGVTSGLDFGLTLVAQLAGERMAQLVQLGQEYEPRPPFNSGSPATAPAEIVQQFRTVSAKSTAERLAAATRAAAKFPPAA